jgi:hypothetical protein
MQVHPAQVELAARLDRTQRLPRGPGERVEFLRGDAVLRADHLRQRVGVVQFQSSHGEAFLPL